MNDRSHGVRGVARARLLRRKMTATELTLWHELRGKGLGVSFRRQHPVSDFVLDFYAPEVRLAIEVDGPVHQGRRQQDQDRDATLAALGIRVLRIPNDDVTQGLPRVLDDVRSAIQHQDHDH